MIENLAIGFQSSLALDNLLYCFIGCALGTIIGVLPGLGPTATIALLLTVTYKLPLISAIIMLSGIYYGAQYGGTITSVLLRIPGEAASVVTCIDGYAMALRGEAGKALGIAAFGSFIAGTIGTLLLSLLAPPLSKVALMFGPPEYSAVMIFGLLLVIYIGSSSKIKAILMGAIGLTLGCVGMDPMTAVERFTFGSLFLSDGINLGIFAMGIFGIGEILYMAENASERTARDSIKYSGKTKDLLPNRQDWKLSFMPITRGTLIGFILGVMPGGGAVVASFASYATEKIFSKHPEKFGNGAIEGVAGPEAANNSAVSGAFIPLLTLGIPSNVVMALLIGAFMMHGVIPGPFILIKYPEVFWGIITSMYIGNIILVILNVPLIKFFVKITEIPYALLSPLIVFICVIGAFSLNNNIDDIFAMIIFGIIGYLMKKYEYDPAPLVLAFVVGPILEESLRQSLVISRGNLSIFVASPISTGLITTFLIVVVISVIFDIHKNKVRSVLK